MLIVFCISMQSCNGLSVSKPKEETVSDRKAATESQEIESSEGESASDESYNTSETVTGEDTGVTPEKIKNGEVTFLTEDGKELNGNIFGQGNKWVILSHMYPTDQTGWFDFAGDLAKNGYVAFTFDFRGYGKSKGSKDDLGNIYKDILAAIALARTYGSAKIFLVGASMGGTASIIAASKDNDINGIVSLAAPDKMGNDLDAISVVSGLKMPKIFISAIGDEHHAESARKLYEEAVEPKVLEIMENSFEHGTFIFEKEPENAERLKSIILNFLDSVQ